jgi:heme-degrading monooxygenase HmoA
VIARIWRGAVAADRADDYLAYLHETGLADYANTPGNRGVTLLRRNVEHGVEFTTITFWDSMEAIRAFAGDQPELARYYPRDDEFLLAREPFVEHHEVPFAAIPELPAGA